MKKHPVQNKKGKQVAVKKEAKAILSPKVKYNIILSLIVIYTTALFAKSLQYQFVNWDDNDYILQNLLIRDFSFMGLVNIFSTPVLGMYNPFPFVVYTFIYNMAGLDPMPYKLVNLLFHLAATVATFKFIHHLTQRYEAAAIVAILFAIHPMHVTVVAWVSETKSSMYTLFYMLALMNYLKYLRSSYQARFLVYTGLLFLAALLSKPSAVTLAPMLLLLDYYIGRKMDKKLFLEKIPFFALSLLFGLLTIYTHIEIGDSIFEKNQEYSFINNLLISNYSVVFYFNKLLVPLNLSTIYPYPDNAPLMPFRFYFSILVIPFILWLVYKAGNFRKEMIFGLLFFVISISVVLRIVPTGFFRASNVYTYLSYTGLFFIVAQFAIYILDNKLPYARRLKSFVVPFMVLLVVFFSLRTAVRLKVWENSITLFDDVIKKKPMFAIPYNNRGVTKMNLGQIPEALKDLSRAIELDPGYSTALNNRGRILVDIKDYENALKDLNAAIAVDSKFVAAYLNRGNAYYATGRFKEAVDDYSTAIRLDPNIPEAYKSRGTVLLDLKDDDAALRDFNTAISLNPAHVDSYINRAFLFFSRGAYREALADCEKAIQLDPRNATAYANRAAAKYMLNDTLGYQSDTQIASALKGGGVSSPPLQPTGT